MIEHVPTDDPGPYYDDLTMGHVFETPPGVTITDGVAAQYLAITGDALPLAVDAELCHAVTGSERLLVNPGLALHLGIGASTVATRKVLANLFYRNVVLHHPVFIGDTLRTVTSVRGLSDARAKPGAAPRGKALLGIVTTRSDEIIIDCERCPLLPCRGAEAPGHADNLGRADTDVDLTKFSLGSRAGWDLAPLGAHDPWDMGQLRVDPMRDVVDHATGLVRLTHNLASVHRDGPRSGFGERLVYGGHTISLGQASLLRTMRGVATVLGWVSCDHTAPVFEGDLLESTHTVVATAAHRSNQVRAVHTEVWAHRPDTDPVKVLDWKPVLLTT